MAVEIEMNTAGVRTFYAEITPCQCEMAKCAQSDKINQGIPLTLMLPTPKDSQMSLGTFSLWDIALTIAELEAQEWGDEAAMNLFLEPSLTLVRQEAEQMAAQCGQRTGERARVYVLAGKWSLARKSGGALRGFGALGRRVDFRRARLRFELAGRRGGAGAGGRGVAQ